MTYLDHAMRDAHAIELRHLDGERVACGLFDDLGLLHAEIRNRQATGNLYITLNRPSVAAANVMGRVGIKDADIERVVRLPIDFDPVRPRNTSSTAAELAAAVSRRDLFVTRMHSLGWPMPALAVSGNGAHAVYRCLLRADDRTRDALRTIYRSMRATFSDDEVLFDSTVHNSSRIWRLYGSVNRKGTPSVERPHRRAAIVIPQRWEAVSPDLVYGLAAFLRSDPVRVAAPVTPIRGAGDFRTLDVARWFAHRGMYRRALGGGKHAVRCPWNGEHSTNDLETSSATVIWEADGGWPTFHCSHDHCDGRSIRDVIARWGDADHYCAQQWRASA